MKVSSKYLVLTLFFLAGCAPVSTVTYVTPSPLVATATIQPTVISTATATKAPTTTPVPATPTVDLAHLPTQTPQAPAACPKVNDKLRISLGSVFKNKKATYHDARQTVLDFLNEGGDPQLAIEKLAQYGVTASQMDITHDGIKEFFLPSGYFTIFGCQSGKYVTLLDLAPTKYEIAAVPIVIQDLNLNGVPELFIGQAQYSDQSMYYIFEWDGSKLANLAPATFKESNTKVYIKQQIIYTIGQSNAQKGALLGNYDIVDTDGNGLKEIIIHAGVYKNWFESSDLEDTLVLKWDGKSYVVGEVSKEASPTPEPTFTPLPFSATCSYKVPTLRYKRPDDLYYKVFIKSIEDFLNAGGVPEQLNSYFNTTIQDLNGDHVPEILLIDSFVPIPSIYLFSCQDGKYKDTNVYDNDGSSNSISVMSITDNNKNGFPEIFVKEIGCFWNRCGALSVVEWDGEKFAQKLKIIGGDGDIILYAYIDEPTDAYLKDVDNDKIKELVWTGEVTPAWHGDHWSFYPQRLATHVFKWDGTNYSALPVEYAASEYRFQTVQDGDLYSEAGLYEKALKAYQMAIKSEGLGWWTEERKIYIIGQHGFGPCAAKDANCPQPTPDPNERPILSAYATFRIMLVQLLTDNQIEAEKAYQEILAKYPPDNPGYPIAEMSTAFWTEYQTSQNMEQSCAKVVASIQNQDSILKILTGGSSLQGIYYENKPEEVCPFK